MEWIQLTPFNKPEEEAVEWKARVFALVGYGPSSLAHHAERYRADGTLVENTGCELNYRVNHEFTAPAAPKNVHDWFYSAECDVWRTALCVQRPPPIALVVDDEVTSSCVQYLFRPQMSDYVMK